MLMHDPQRRTTDKEQSQQLTQNTWCLIKLPETESENWTSGGRFTNIHKYTYGMICANF